MKDFVAGAAGLTKNPLGVIGLFVCLVYGLACVVLMFKGRDLRCGESWALVAFVVIFPFVILGVFFQLVTRHHQKLYAPSDYKDERYFLSPSPLSDEEIAERLSQAAKSLGGGERKNGGSTDMEISSPEKIAEKSSNRDPEDVSKSIRSAYGNVERLAFLALEKKIGKPFNKYVGFDVNGVRFEFDGYFEDEGGLHLIEVAFLKKSVALNSMLLDQKFDELISHAEALWVNVFPHRHTLWIAFVYDFPKEELRAATRGRPSIHGRSTHLRFNLNVQYLNLEELQKTYG